MSITIRLSITWNAKHFCNLLKLTRTRRCLNSENIRNYWEKIRKIVNDTSLYWYCARIETRCAQSNGHQIDRRKTVAQCHPNIFHFYSSKVKGNKGQPIRIACRVLGSIPGGCIVQFDRTKIKVREVSPPSLPELVTIQLCDDPSWHWASKLGGWQKRFSGCRSRQPHVSVEFRTYVRMWCYYTT